MATPDPQPRWTSTRTRAQSRSAPARWSNQKAAFDVAVLMSAAAALGQNVREVELRCLSLGAGSRNSLASGSAGPLSGLRRRRLRAPTVNLLPCMDRSGMRAPRAAGAVAGAVEPFTAVSPVVHT